MTMIGAIKKSIDFIEANLYRDIGVADAANAGCYSQFYFSRQFSLHTHISVYDYILKRKLSEAYKTLFSDSPRILDLAVQYGFQSHEVFTRAFRKMFGENPSEASLMKPLLIYERIDDSYLSFLTNLKIDVIDSVYPDCCFEVGSTACCGESTLMILSEDMLSCKTILTGCLTAKESKFLSFGLSNLKHMLRVHHTDVKHTIRYFTDNFYDANRVTSNYIVLKKDNGYIDIIIP